MPEVRREARHADSAERGAAAGPSTLERTSDLHALHVRPSRGRVEEVSDTIEPVRRHVIADCAGIDVDLLDDARSLADLLKRAATDAGATVLDCIVRSFEPHGVTVVCVLAESHCSLHTWPEHGMAFVDAFTCGDVSPWELATAVVAALDANGAELAEIETTLIAGTMTLGLPRSLW